MAISRTERPDLTYFVPNPELNSPLPLGLWKSSTVITGDGTGGKITVTVAPATAAAAALYLWSWESGTIMVSPNAVNKEIVFVMVSGERYFDSTGAVTSVLFANQGFLRTDTSRIAAQLFDGKLLSFVHQPGNGLTNSYAIDVDNINGYAYSYGFWGYIWHPESRRLAGGPRRP